MCSNYAEASKNDKVKKRHEEYKSEKKKYDEQKSKFDEWKKKRDEKGADESDRLLYQKPPVEPAKPKEIKEYQKPVNI